MVIIQSCYNCRARHSGNVGTLLLHYAACYCVVLLLDWNEPGVGSALLLLEYVRKTEQNPEDTAEHHHVLARGSRARARGLLGLSTRIVFLTQVPARTLLVGK
jgi:hypothetical protein